MRQGPRLGFPKAPWSPWSTHCKGMQSARLSHLGCWNQGAHCPTELLGGQRQVPHCGSGFPGSPAPCQGCCAFGGAQLPAGSARNGLSRDNSADVSHICCFSFLIPPCVETFLGNQLTPARARVQGESRELWGRLLPTLLPIHPDSFPHASDRTSSRCKASSWPQTGLRLQRVARVTCLGEGRHVGQTGPCLGPRVGCVWDVFEPRSKGA
ncbi:hypothetical protein KIL84_021361 [Mauremys mutica]|uniref:Uncharacterized protein n=1 Tax=Mauremys mutica TaxID=74926 RepID=A0A9D3X8N4_9SAUR|nr:hypothetical protein KIL84_021361 [Mauremys mutica]